MFENYNAKEGENHIIDIERYAKDSRLTEISDGKIYDYRAAFKLIKQLGRPLTEKEAETFRIK